jgi:hypothetical protein
MTFEIWKYWYKILSIWKLSYKAIDRLCFLEVRIPGYTSSGPGSNLGATNFSERGPLSLASTIEELLGRKSSGSGLEIR